MLSGFYGRSINQNSDSFGDISGTSQSFVTTMLVNTGDTLDVFTYTGNNWPSADISWSIAKNTNIAQCNSIAELKAAARGTQVMLMTPMTVTAAITRYQPDANGNKAFYIESDDRGSALELVGDNQTATPTEGTKITFSGNVVADPADASRNVIQITSINDQTTGTVLQPVGMTGKALSAGLSPRDRFVRVWGKVTSTIANTGSDNDRWPYEFYVIDDGSGPIKVRMHGQATYMTDATPLNAATVGHYISVIGIVRKEGSDWVIFPRGYGSGLADLSDYWYIDQPHS